MKLWSEHVVELKDNELIKELFDPFNEHVHDYMSSIVKHNTKIYCELFNCYPDDMMPNFQDIPSPKVSSNETEIEDLMKKYTNKAK